MTLRLRALFWENSLAWRRPARKLRRRLLGGETPHAPESLVETTPLAPPAIQIETPDETIAAFLTRQTEASISEKDGEFLWLVDGDPSALPSTHLEELLLVAVSQRLAWSESGDLGGGKLLRKRVDTTFGPIFGKRLAAPPALSEYEAEQEVAVWPAASPLAALADLPPVDGPRTVLFLLPNLSVGGAERQLFDLLESLRERARVLVVTVDPHTAQRGCAIERCRKIVPQVYALGDLLPRAVRFEALCHLIRRWKVETLVSWNGSVLFYDHAADLRERFPDLRIAAQLYDSRGGWAARLGPRTRRAIDLHLVVNRRTAQTLESRLAIAPERIALIHHGVEIPERDFEAVDRRRALRAELGLPDDAIVVGTFIRMHAQKRPQDVLALARRLPNLHFLLVGGGPADAAIDADLAKRPIDNLVRLSLRDDASELYDAVDLCLSTSAYEGLPFFLLDALARGIPCVATDVGDVPLLLADGGGRLAKPGDLAALARGLEELIDADVRRREGEIGQETIRRAFHLRRFQEETTEVLFD